MVYTKFWKTEAGGIHDGPGTESSLPGADNRDLVSFDAGSRIHQRPQGYVSSA